MIEGPRANKNNHPKENVEEEKNDWRARYATTLGILEISVSPPADIHPAITR